MLSIGRDAIHYEDCQFKSIKKAYDDLQEMKHIYKKQRRFEKYLLRLDKRTVRFLNKEKNVK